MTFVRAPELFYISPRCAQHSEILAFCPSSRVKKAVAVTHPGQGTGRDVHALHQNFEWF
jgi:hypothetical protein